jgi:hypothetical protein
VLVVGKADKRRSFGLLLPDGTYHCFRCGVVGRLSEAWIPSTKAGKPLDERPPNLGPPPSFARLYEEPGASARALASARAYLVKRRLPVSIWAQAGIGACIMGRFAGRVVVPVISGARWLGYVGRAWEASVELKYLYPRGMSRGSTLYNQVALAERTDRPLFVVEGVFDALALWPDAVAVLGKPSRIQVAMLEGAARPVVVALDGDAWAEGEMLGLRLRFRGVRAGSVHLPPCTDPDEVPLDLLVQAGLRSLGSLRAVAVG